MGYSTTYVATWVCKNCLKLIKMKFSFAADRTTMVLYFFQNVRSDTAAVNYSNNSSSKSFTTPRKLQKLFLIVVKFNLLQSNLIISHKQQQQASTENFRRQMVVEIFRIFLTTSQRKKVTAVS